MQLNSFESIVLAISVLLLGYLIQSKVRFFKKIYIPAPLIGGIFFAVTLLIFNDVKIGVDYSVIPIFTALFFASIGLRIDKNIFKGNFKNQMIFLVLAIVIAFGQNVISLGLGSILGLAKPEMVASGSLGLIGDNTFVKYISGFDSTYTGLLNSIASLTIIIGTVLGAVIFKILKSKTDTTKTIKLPPAEFNSKEFLTLIFILSACSFIGMLPSKFGIGNLINPAGGAFLSGLIARQLFDMSKVMNIKTPQINLLGNMSLSMLLILNFMSLNIASIGTLKPSIIIIIVVQCLWISLFSLYIVYKLYGKNHLALYAASGIIGFSIGSPASTMSNIQCYTENEGAVPPILFIVPPVGAWMIAVLNTYIAGLFM